MPVEIEIKKKPYGKVKVGVIPVPAGLEIPQGLEPGETFDLTTSYALTEDGQLEPLFVEGLELAAESEGEDFEEEEVESDGRDMFMEGLSNKISQSA